MPGKYLKFMPNTPAKKLKGMKIVLIMVSTFITWFSLLLVVVK